MAAKRPWRIEYQPGADWVVVATFSTEQKAEDKLAEWTRNGRIAEPGKYRVRKRVEFDAKS